MMSSKSFALGLAVIFASAVNATAQGRVTMRFQAMDRNGDGRITRAEWRGSDRSFEIHDWNHDGVLSGEEVRVDGVRRDRQDDEDFDSTDREYVFDQWTDRGFRSLDHNGDNRITRDEWHFARQEFRLADHNNDGAISRAEFLNQDGIDDDRDDQLPYLDVNRDLRVSRSEWHGSPGRFNALDTNRDGFLTREELSGTDAPPDLFTSIDVNRDRVISRNEWHWSRNSFDQRDANRDGRLTQAEFLGQAGTSGTIESNAYRTGFERGMTEGREAGRSERVLNRAWDLEGQTELEAADSGYQPGMGPKPEYQAGYRAGFRRGYRLGWDQAR
jgi:Ca2+-binding EF-hand superfamily protein